MDFLRALTQPGSPDSLFRSLLFRRRHREACIRPGLDAAVEHAGVLKSLSLSAGRLTDGRCIARSASVKEQLGIARQGSLPLFVFAEGNRSF
jgi:hypothetical protein